MYVTDKVFFEKFLSRLHSTYHQIESLLKNSNQLNFIEEQVKKYSQNDFLVARVIPNFIKNSGIILNINDIDTENSQLTIYNISPFSVTIDLDVFSDYLETTYSSNYKLLSASDWFISLLFSGKLSLASYSISSNSYDWFDPLNLPNVSLERLIKLDEIRFREKNKDNYRPYFKVTVPTNKIKEILNKINSVDNIGNTIKKERYKIINSNKKNLENNPLIKEKYKIMNDDKEKLEINFLKNKKIDLKLENGITITFLLKTSHIGEKLQTIFDFDHNEHQNCTLQVKKITNIENELAWFCAGEAVVKHIQNNTLYHVAVGVDLNKNEIFLLINGEIIAKNINSRPLNHNVMLTIGSLNDKKSRLFKGYLDNINIWPKLVPYSHLLEESFIYFKNKSFFSIYDKNFPSVSVLLSDVKKNGNKNKFTYIISNLSDKSLTIDLNNLVIRHFLGEFKVGNPVKGIEYTAWDIDQKNVISSDEVILSPMKKNLSIQSSPWFWTGGISGLLSGTTKNTAENSIIFEATIENCHKIRTDISTLIKTVDTPIQMVLLEPSVVYCPGQWETNSVPGTQVKASDIQLSSQKSGAFTQAKIFNKKDKTKKAYEPRSLLNMEHLQDDNMVTAWMVDKNQFKLGYHAIDFKFDKPILVNSVKIAANMGEISKQNDNHFILQATNIGNRSWRTLTTNNIKDNNGWIQLNNTYFRNYKYYRLINEHLDDLVIKEVRFDSKKQSSSFIKLEDILDLNDFFVKNTLLDGKIVVSPMKSKIIINDVIKVGDNYVLEFPAGSEVVFSEKGGLLVFGAIKSQGNKENRVIFRPIDKQKGFKGIAIINSTESNVFQYSKFTGGNGGFFGVHQLSGGFSVFNSKIEITNSEFSDIPANDAIHFSKTYFKIENSEIHNTLSDTLDVDWGVGVIKNTAFYDCGLAGGDCVDFSSSRVWLSHLDIDHTLDKGISIGEGSVIDVNDVFVKNANVGMAVKDGSIVVVENSTFSNNKYGVLQYIKKPYYSYPKIMQKNCKFNKNGIDFYQEKKSSWTRKYD